jgi:hypothetical protein
MHCRASLIGCLVALACPPAPALDEAGPHSRACRDALAALQARESVLAAAASQPSATIDRRPRSGSDRIWLALRGRAAKACLGADPATPAPAPESVTAPIVVPPVAAPAPSQVARPPLLLPPPLPPIEHRRAPPATVNCDARGCDAGNGTRLPYTGRNPLDPGVRCIVQGSLVVCL